MNNQYYNLRLYFCCAAAILIFAGCAPKIQEPIIEISPDKYLWHKESVVEALSVLKARSQKAVPLRIKGRSVLQYYDAEKKKHKKESLTFLILVKPPLEIYFQGDATLVHKAIVLGSNEREYWLLMRPKEISTYWLGQWSEQDSYKGLKINPKTLFESLGLVETGAEENTCGTSWSLSNEGAFDVLTKRDRGVVIKKMHIYGSDYLVNKIEYFDSDGLPMARTELENYKEVSDGFFVPVSIKIIAYGQSSGLLTENKVEESLSITLNLKSIKPEEITEKKRNVFFNPPPRRGFEHILINEGGEWIEQRR